MMIKAIVFDFDGVLADSEPLHLRAYQTVLARFGVTLSRDDYYANYLGYDDQGVFAQLTARHGIQVDEQGLRALIDEKTRVFDATIETGIDSGGILYPGAAACVAQMASRYPLGIASGALRHEIEAILRGAKLDHYFQFLVASGETPEGKPAPDPYRRAAELHAFLPEECVAIEDSRWGIESAKAAGLACVGITTTYASEHLTAADRIIASLDEFTPDLVDALRREAR
jgi:beta-phosphoglucomutase-like phosphatase (HAD superfamily)